VSAHLQQLESNTWWDLAAVLNSPDNYKPLELSWT
jgi:hypothetical protein